MVSAGSMVSLIAPRPNSEHGGSGGGGGGGREGKEETFTGELWGSANWQQTGARLSADIETARARACRWRVAAEDTFRHLTVRSALQDGAARCDCDCVSHAEKSEAREL